MKSYIVSRKMYCTQTLLVEASSANEARDKANTEHAYDTAVEVVVDRIGKVFSVKEDKLFVSDKGAK